MSLKKIKMSECLKQRLTSMKNNKVSKLLLKLSSTGFDEQNFNNNYPDSKIIISDKFVVFDYTFLYFYISCINWLLL